MTFDAHKARSIGVHLKGTTMTVELIEGDCREVLKELDANSIDAIVTDPPYGLEFMGKAWDSPWKTDRRQTFDGTLVDGRENPYGRSKVRNGSGASYGADARVMQVFQQWCTTWAVECLRVLKPGGHLLSFGGTRTYHRMASAIEDAGFEIRDQIGWLYGSGFPKSHNQHGEWEGWGTALKPAWEPIVLARKPLIGTVAANLAAHGVGALNIDDCRIELSDGDDPRLGGKGDWASDKMAKNVYEGGYAGVRVGSSPLGRWPANVIHDGSDEVAAAFPYTTSRKDVSVKKTSAAEANGNRGAAFGKESHPAGTIMTSYGDKGSASRFFYAAKCSKADRDDGMTTEPKPVITFATANGTSGKPSSISEGRNTEYRNTHPTVKPTDLMRYLCRLVTPPGGTVLDPFMGSGSTGRGAVLEGFSFIGIEMSAEYFDIADARIAAAESTMAKTMQAAE